MYITIFEKQGGGTRNSTILLNSFHPKIFFKNTGKSTVKSDYLKSYKEYDKTLEFDIISIFTHTTAKLDFLLLIL